MFYHIPEDLEGLLIYRVVQRKKSSDLRINKLPTLGYITATNSSEAFNQLTKKFGICSGYIPVLYKENE